MTTAANTGPRTLTVEEVAKALSIGRRTAWRLVADRQLRSVRIGRAVRIPVDEVEAFIERGGTAGVAER